MRATRRACLLAVGIATASSPAFGAETIEVVFTSGGDLQRVERPLPAGKGPVAMALRYLVRGPSTAERADGVSTALPKGIAVQELLVRDGIAFVRFSTPLGLGGSRRQAARLQQVVRTLTRIPKVKVVRVLDPGELVPTQVDGKGLSVNELPRAVERSPIPYSTSDVQAALVGLGYLRPSAVTGRLDYGTQQALLAFQGWEGLRRDAAPGRETRTRLTTATRPRPRITSRARRIEVHQARGVALLIERGTVRRAVHISSGAGGASPRGSFRIFRKERNSWSIAFGVNLPYASYFHRGYAFHQYPFVPSYQASHGCIRVPSSEAAMVYEFARFGTTVQVY